MKLFLDVPIVQQATILCKWLELKDVVQLDSALCCKATRPQFLLMLDTKCVFPILDTVYKDETEWAMKRNVKFIKLRLRHKTAWSPPSRERILETTGQAVHILELCQDEVGDADPKAPEELPIGDIYFDIAEYCPMLQEFAMWSEKVSSNLNLLLLKCPQLRSLHMEGCTGINPGTIKSICDLPKLARLSVSEAQFDESELYAQYKSQTLLHLFADCVSLSGKGQVMLTSCFPNLLGVCLGVMSSAELLLIAQNCPCMKFANMRLSDPLVDNSAVALSKLWTHIQLLQLRRESYEDIVCKESTVLVLLRGCANLLKLSVCEMNDPHNDDFLYYKRHQYNMIAMANATSTSTTAINTTTSAVTDLFVNSLSEAHLIAIIALCPQLDTLAIRHHNMYIAPRIATYAIVMNSLTGGSAHNNTTETNEGLASTRMAHLNAAEYALHRVNTSSIRKLHLNHISSLCARDLLPLKHLQELQLSHISFDIDDETILTVVANNPDLTSLSLHYCRGVTKNVIVPVLTSAKKLHTFYYRTATLNPSVTGGFGFVSAMSVLYDLVKYSFPHVTNFSFVI